MSLRFTLTALAALALSCKTPTQITVVLKGRGIACSQAEGGAGSLLERDPLFDESGVVVGRSLDAESGALEVGARKTDSCRLDVDGSSALGEVVLVPGPDGSAVEVLAVAVVTRDPPPPAQPSTVEECLVEYQRLAGGAPCTVDDACVGCIFASRSLEFLDATRLTLEIELSTACAGVFCGVGSTCVDGACTSAVCRSGDPACTIGSGGGGAEGQGGEGSGGKGEGGGTVDDGPWTRLSAIDVDGVEPWEVVGVGQGEAHSLVVAADRRLCTIATGDVPSCSEIADSGTYRAVAARNAAVVSAGVHGLKRNLIDLTPAGYAPTAESTIDVSVGTTLGIDWLYFGSQGAMTVGNSTVEPDDVSGGALFSVGTAVAFVFQASGSALSRKSSNAKVDLEVESSQWLMWGVEIAARPWPLFLVAGDGAGEVRRIDFDPVLQQYETLRLYTPALDDLVGPVTAVFGEHPDTSTLRLWAVGGGDAPWLRSTEIDVDDVNATLLTWTERPLPASLSGALRSVWASETFVAIAGPGGVYEARVSDLLK